MGRTKTAGIQTDADGCKIVDKRAFGVRIKRRLGRIDQQQAEAWLAKELDARRQAQLFGARAARTFREAAVRYLEEHPHLRARVRIRQEGPRYAAAMPAAAHRRRSRHRPAQGRRAGQSGLAEDGVESTYHPILRNRIACQMVRSTAPAAFTVDSNDSSVVRADEFVHGRYLLSFDERHKRRLLADSHRWQRLSSTRSCRSRASAIELLHYS